MSASPLRVGLVGLGFMGRTHAAAWRAAAADGVPVELAGGHDAGAPAAPAGGNLDVGGDDDPLADLPRAASLDELLAPGRVDAIDLCTPTDTHVELALRALDAGLHVLVEKPVALDVAAIEALDARSRETGRIVMPAMCMRFWPAWTRIAEAVREERLGPVRAASFERLGPSPSWSRAFYLDPDRSGGALVDLHVHDVDFVHQLFGPPDEVDADGDALHVVARYRWHESARHVVARGAWLPAASFPFRMRLLVACSEGVLDFDLARDAPLLVHDHEGTRPFGPEGAAAAAEGTGYDGEVRAFARAVRDGAPPPVTLAEAAAVMRTIERERAALSGD